MLGCDPDPNKPAVLEPGQNAQIATSSAYIRILVLKEDLGAGQYHEVFLREEGVQDPPIDITSSFTLADGTPPTKDRLHANVDLPLGTYEVWVVQHKGTSTWQSLIRKFSLVTGLATEYGALTGLDGGTAGKVVTQAIGGAVGRPAPSSDLALLFGETDLNGGAVHPTTIAFSTDTDPTDGLTTSYYDEAGIGTIEAALGPLVAGETEIELAAPFVDGSDVYAFYWRTHTTGPKEVGLAKMSGGTPPFVRQTFPNTSTLFGDTYSLFEDGDLQPASGGVVSGSDLYLYGLQLPGGATSHEVYSARVPLNAVMQASSYEYWTASGWQSAPTTPLALWNNSGAPSVAYNTQEARWVAVHSVEQGLIYPYLQEDSHSALAVRVAHDLEGPWTEPVVVWERPQTLLTGTGSAHSPVILPGLESLSKITIAANDGGEWTRPENAYLYEIDLSQIVFPPILELPSDPTTFNPHSATGVANSGDLVRIFVNGEEQGSATAAADGSFTIPIILLDGPNSVHAVADSGGKTSDPSAVVTFNYENAVQRAVVGPITTDTVWTPGQAPGITGPYIVSSDLTIDSAATLTIQPGVEVRLAPGADLTVDGGLRIQGDAAQRVLLTSDGGTTPGSWPGIDVSSGGQAILDEVDIRYAAIGIDVNAGDLQLSNAAISEFNQFGIQVRSGGTASITSSIIDGTLAATLADGIYLNATGAVTIDSTTVRAARTGIILNQSSPVITTCTIEDNTLHGLLIKDRSDPVVSGGTVITGNANSGVRVEGENDATQDPNPQITGSDIFDNDIWDFYAQSYENAAETSLIATSNWWGDDDPAVIVAGIRDQSDNSAAPVVQFTPYLDASSNSGGQAVSGQFLNGEQTGTIYAGSSYLAVGDLVVPDGANLTINPGVHIQFLPDVRVRAVGNLHIAGTDTQVVHLESSKADPAPGDWDGVYIESTSIGSLIEHALIDHADFGVHVSNTYAVVRDNDIRDSKDAGVFLEGSSALVQRNGMSHPLGAAGQPSGIRVTEQPGSTGAPTLSGNSVTGAETGIQINGAGSGAPTVQTVENNVLNGNGTGLEFIGGVLSVVSGNFITGNTDFGILIDGGRSIDPLPAINGNDIHDNGPVAERDLYVGNGYSSGGTTLIDASSNWWGVADTALIADLIRDYSDSTSAAVAGFTPFLSNSIGMGGTPVSGNYLSGPQADTTVLSSGSTYEVAGTLYVAPGDTLTVESGAILKFTPSTGLRIDGTLVDQGGTYTALSATPARDEWDGIRFTAGSTGSSLTGTIVKWADTAIDVDGTQVDVQSADIREFKTTGISYRNGATGTVSATQVDNTDTTGTGIYVESASPTLLGNDVRNTDTGVYMLAASPLVLANTVDSNTNGLWIQNQSSPTISNGNIITNNQEFGVLIDRTNGVAPNPAPVITGNEIKSNNVGGTGLNLKADGFDTPLPTLDATLNYWGSDSIIDISDWIFDNTDDPVGAPVVEIDPWRLLDGTASTGNVLQGTLTAGKTLGAGTSWTVIGSVTVPSLQTLTIEDGVDVQVVPGASIFVDGTLLIQGTSGSRAVLRSAEAIATAGAWEGIFIRASSTGSNIQYADIRHARHGVDINGTSSVVAISDTLFSDFGSGGVVPGAGVRIENAAATLQDNDFSHALGHPSDIVHGVHLVGVLAGTQVHGGSIQNMDHGISIEGGSPSIEGVTIQNNDRGIHITAEATPTIDNKNVITANAYGIYVKGGPGASLDPQPVVQDNDIEGNNSGGPLYNFFSVGLIDVALEIDASLNWWGDTTLAGIAGGIFDLTDGGAGEGMVDFLPFMDRSVLLQGVAEVNDSAFLAGVLGDATALSAGTPYQAAGTLVVAPGETLTVPQGAELAMPDGSQLIVRGKLDVLGVSGNRALFTSANGSPTAGAWEGIVVEATSIGSSIVEATVEYATRGVWAKGSDVTISNSEIRNFSVAGIEIHGPATGTIADNSIHSGGQTGIYLSGASPAITHNTIQGAMVGIYMQEASNPVINGGNTITANEIGIQLQGAHDVARNPDPTVNDNDIFGNVWAPGVDRNLQVSNYYFEGIGTVLKFQRNWWGDSVPSNILATIDTTMDTQAVAIDLSDRLNGLYAQGGTTIAGPVYSLLLTNVSHASPTFNPLLGEKARVDFDLSAPATVTIRFYLESEEPLMNVVYSDSSSLPAGPNFLEWDGQLTAGGYAPEDGYAYTLEADDGVIVSTYNPRDPSENTGDPGTVPGLEWTDSDPEYNAYRNDFWKQGIQITGDETRFSFTIKVEPNTFHPVWDRYLPEGNHQLVWDGRDENGVPLQGEVTIETGQAPQLRYNHVIVQGTQPKITGLAPVVEVKSDPWLITHSYEQQSEIKFELDQDSYVTVKLLPPGIVDPNDPDAELLVDNELKTASGGPHLVTWTGLATGEENSFRVEEEGPFTFTIDATGAQSGLSTLYRGALQIRR